MFLQTADRTVYRLTNSLTSDARTLQFFYKCMFQTFSVFEMFTKSFEHFNIKRTELFFPVHRGTNRRDYKHRSKLDAGLIGFGKLHPLVVTTLPLVQRPRCQQHQQLQLPGQSMK